MSVNVYNKTEDTLIPVAGGTVYADSPIGSIVPYGGSQTPAGWLICDGRSLSKNDYFDLFKVIGYNFGGSDSTFNVPDLREAVPVGIGENDTQTIEAHDVYTLGQFKDDQLQKHGHSFQQEGGNPPSGVPINSKIIFGGSQTSAKYNTNAIQSTSVIDARTGTTTHGKQLGVNYIIKVKHTPIPADFMDAVDDAVEDVYGDIIPSDASASNKLVAESDTNSTTLTSTDSLASWAGNAKGVMTAFITTSSKPSDIGTPLSSWGETMIWCIGDGIRKTLFAVDYSVPQQVIYTRKYFNGSFITDWTAIKDGNLTSSVTPGSTAPITSGGVYDALAPVDISSSVTVGSGITIRANTLHVVKSGHTVSVSFIIDSISNLASQYINILTGLPAPVLNQELSSICFTNSNIYYNGYFFDNGTLRMYERTSGFSRVQFTYICV